MIAVPAIDLIGGRCVRLTRGDFDTSVTYSDDPLGTARRFEDAGLSWIHIVDLDGAKSGKPVHFGTLETIKKSTGLKVDFGGGLRSIGPVAEAFNCGADMVTVGSAAVRSPRLLADWMNQFGSERFILAADVRGDRIAVSGWQETSGRKLSDALTEFVDLGLQKVMITDVARDGTLEGPAVALYSKIKSRFPGLFTIASGGVSRFDDLLDLAAADCDAAIVGKAIYEGRIELSRLAGFAA